MLRTSGIDVVGAMPRHRANKKLQIVLKGPDLLPRDPVQRVALRLARARGRESRMGVDLVYLWCGRRPDIPNNGDLERAIPRMSTGDIEHARASRDTLAAYPAHDQRLVEGLLETLADAERRRLTVLVGGRT